MMMGVGLEMGGLTEEQTFFGFIVISWNRIEIFYETEIARFNTTLLSDHRNNVEKNFWILIKLNFVNISTTLRGKD